MRERNIGRRAISLLLALVLALSLLPASALAAGNAVASVGGQPYTKLSDAWNQAVSSGQTLELLQNATIGDRLKLENGKSLTVNMNGHEIDRNRSSRTSDGEVIWVGENATLTLKGRGTVTGGWSTNGAGGIHMKKNAKVMLDGVTVSGNRAERSWGSDGYGGGVMMAGTGGQLVMKNDAAIRDNTAAYGGGVYIDKENCTISMDNAHIDNNYSEYGGGGVYSYDLKTVIDMTNHSTISNNSATEGGGIYFDYTQFLLKSSDATAQISNNTARDGKGGALYMEHNRSVAFIGNTNSGTVQGITFDGNHATDYGGAIYIQQESIVISNCQITHNQSDNYGGGIYNNNDANTISGCAITDNKAGKAGGGVYSSSMNDISLSGKVVIKDNTRTSNTSSGNKDDLYLNDAASTSYLIGSPSGKSCIGVRTEDPTTRKLGKNQDYYFENAFFSDLSGYYIEFREEDKQLWLVQGTRTSAEPTSVAPTTTTTKNGYNQYDLIKGYFSFPSVVETTDDLDSVFYYSDGYFMNNPTTYNEHLATMSMTMAMAGFYSNIGNDGSKKNSTDDLTYTYKSQNIRKLFSDIGVGNIYVSDSNAVKPGINTIGVAIGQKTIGTSEDGYVLVPIAVRGAGYESEWYGNTSVGASGEHEGFAIAADQVFQQVQNYIKNYGLTDKINQGKVKFWIAGYSRAGATSNLTAKRLIEAYCAQNGSDAMKNQVYAYCFEAPKGGLNSAMKLSAEKYYSIHNCINKADAVPLVAPEEMGFIRYGVDHYIPGAPKAGSVQPSSKIWSYVEGQPWVSGNKGYTTWYDNTAYATYSGDYQKQRTEMLKQLKAVDPTNIYFYDNFSAATVEYIKSVYGQPLIQMVPTYKGEKGLTQEEFGPVLIRALQSWGFYRSYEGDFRYGYSGQFSNSEGKVGVSFEYALQTVTKILFSKSAADLNGMMEAASSTMDRLSTGQLLDIWDDMIGDWTTLSQSKRESYLQMLWDAVVEGTNVEGKSVATYLSDEEETELRSVWNVLLDVLLRFVEVDYNTELYNLNNSKTPINSVKTPVAEEYADSLKTYDSAHTQAVLGTLAYNATALMQAHYPEINFAWLRSYDSFYGGDTTPVEITAATIPKVTSQISAISTDWTTATSGKTYEGNQQLKLSTTTEGAGIYYRINGGVWKPYNQPIPLTLKDDKSTTYKVETTAAYCGNTAGVSTATYTITPIPTYAVKVNDTTIGQYPAGATVTIDGTTNAPKNSVFKSWNITDLNVTLDNANNVVTTFTMPNHNVAITANYVTLISNVTLSVEKPEAGKTLPEQGTLSWSEGETQKTQTVSVFWLEQLDENKTQTATGTAKYGTKYSVAALVEQNLNSELVFASDLKNDDSRKDGKVQYGDKAAADAYKVYVDEAGALRIFGDQIETAKAKVTEVPALTVSIVKDSTSEQLKALLPTTVAVTTEDGVKTTNLEYTDTELGKVQLSKPGSYNIQATINYGSLNVEPNSNAVANVTVTVSANGVVAAPTAERNESSVTLSCASAGAKILYKLNDANYTEYTEAITLNCDEGECKTFVITAKATESGWNDSSEVTFTYTIDKPFTVTIHGKDTGTKKDELWDTVKTYTYHKGDTVTIAAPAEADELFERWEAGEDSGYTLATEDATKTALVVNGIQNNITLTAVYNPVVKKLDLTMDAPSLGVALAKNVKNAVATVTKENDVTGFFADIEWTPAAVGGMPSYNTAYTAKLRLKDNIGMKFFLADQLTLKVNGGGTARAVKENGTDVVYVTFPATQKAGLVSIEQPENKKVRREDAKDHKWGLSDQMVTLNLADGTQKEASVRIWTVSGYNDTLEAQTLTVTGEVTIPEDVEQGSVSNAVTFNIYVPAADQVAAPTANIASGTYQEAQEIRLDCDTEGATIYYTLDGSEPTTTNGTKYDGGIVTVSGYGTTQLRMIAVQENMRDSMEVSYQYTIERHSSGGGSGKPTQPTEPVDPTPSESGFQDVSKDAYYADAVAWAVKQGVTNGVSETQFGPDQGCTRAQIVTFLWRSAGSPEPKALTSFADVPADAYYAKAVAWAVEQGITKGTSETAFSPDATCTRAQSVTFLHRADGSPAATEESKFSDVAQDSYYADAVDWAAANGVTSGTSETTFSPALTCTRGQIVTFLYRMEQGK